MSGTKPMAECLVIGGGLAGAMTALRLAEAGREVALLEKESTAHHKVCGEFLSPEAVLYLRQCGVDPLRLGAVSIRNLRVSAGARTIEVPLPFTALSLSRSILDTALLSRARQQGTAVHRGVSVARLDRHRDIWIAEDLAGDALCARTVFLATGKHDLRGWSRGPGVQGNLVGFKMHWRLKPAHTAALRGGIELFLFAGGYGGLSLVENDTANLCFLVKRSAVRKRGGWAGLLALLRQQNHRMRQYLDEAQPLWERPLAISSIPYGYLLRERAQLWPVGDQAAVIPSFTGDGMSIALHSAALAAEMYLSGRAPHEYRRTLRAQLRNGMSLATLLSRAMVMRGAGAVAPFLLSAYPRVLSRIAQATRIPGPALLRGTHDLMSQQ